LWERAARGAAALREREASAVVTSAAASTLTPVTLFAACLAGVPYVPLNYRLSEESMARLLDRHPGALVVRDVASEGALASAEWAAMVSHGPIGSVDVRTDDAEIAGLIYTSGTTSAPKAAVLRHSNLVRYVLENVEFASADEDDAALLSLPPYHIAGLMSILSNLFMGRRLVFLPKFDPRAWCATVEREQITHATVVPTMLARLIAWARTLDEVPALSSLRTLASGGAVLPVPVIRRVLECWPHVDLVNAYGLTETSSTISVMDPDSYREALASDDEAVRARIASVGHVIPGVDLQIRKSDGSVAAPGENGEIVVRGEQDLGVAGDDQAWFATRDLGYVDAGGYLFVLGRADDTIIRGGENIAPATVEEVLLQAPGVLEAVVVGVPDEEWGERLVAVVVSDGRVIDPQELRTWCRERLRSSLTPDEIAVWPELPTSDAGKVVRRDIVRLLEGTHAQSTSRAAVGADSAT
jgi:acyl-CoA synthetase (AMP-forming)/AMP-acid ligase II